MKRHHNILNPTVRKVRRKPRRCAPTVQTKIDDVCARFPADHAGTQPNRYALFHLVKGCATVEQGCEQVKIIELVRQLQNGDADTFVEFLANSVDPAGNGTAMDATLWCIGSCTVAPVQAYFVKMEKDLGKGTGPPQSLSDFVSTASMNFASNPPLTREQTQLKQSAAAESEFYRELTASLDTEDVYRWLETEEP
jgi:hypothetical protein